jgi:PTS system nitrogen regulatory IIA component
MTRWSRSVVIDVEQRGFSMNTFAQYLLPENIFLDLNASGKWQAFSKVAALLERQHQLDRELIYRSLCERERLGSTALGRGVAIPHAQIKGLRHSMTAFARLSEPIAFDAPDEQPVSEMFMLFAPEPVTQMHLQILADVSEMLFDERFLARLKTANDRYSVYETFSNPLRKVVDSE